MGSNSLSYKLLDYRIQKWIWQQGWTSLREIQENSIPLILNKDSDVIISAATAGGKTEAAFLPIFSSLLSENEKKLGYQVLYISPLKALINDQYRRLTEITKDIGINITPWHGDVSTSIKNRSLQYPNGVIIITPESLESFLINRKRFVKSVFSSLRYIVIDELHAFIGTERGKQLQSLLSRLESITHNVIPRIAMSATFSDYNIVKEFLRIDNKIPCKIPSSGDSNYEIMISLKEYISSKDSNVKAEISEEIFSKLRGDNNLVFTNSRIDSEEYTVELTDMCEEMGVPNEFRIHHGSLSKIERETVEMELQKGVTPITAFCTTTMELGVDIGKVKTIAQIGTANSVTGLRQRLGRSGRRGEPSILRVFSIENESGLMHDLRSSLVQNIAVVELLREYKYEVPNTKRSHLSTLIQQILSIIVQFGGFYPKEGWLHLCVNGAFNNISSSIFLELLKSLGSKNIISQLDNGQIIIGKDGEKLLKKPDFYTAFITQKEFIVINTYNSKKIGVIQYIPPMNSQILLGGRRWLVDSINKDTSQILVHQIKSGGSSYYYSGGAEINRIIIEKMREIYCSSETYKYLDNKTKAPEHLFLARAFFKSHSLDCTNFLEYGNKTVFFTWAGDTINRTISLFLKNYLHKECNYNAIMIEDVTIDDLKIIISKPILKPEELAKLEIRPLKERQKYDYLLSDSLLNFEYALSYLDIDSSINLIKTILQIK